MKRTTKGAKKMCVEKEFGEAMRQEPDETGEGLFSTNSIILAAVAAAAVIAGVVVVKHHKQAEQQM